ncbi:MAG: CvpA family protein [Eubacterium sp.]|nr:CvpA family protein [Eubacterium sp.]
MYYIYFGIGAILLISGLVGLKRGLLKTLFGLIALVVSLAVTFFVTPYVSSYLIEETVVEKKIEEKIYNKLEDSMKEKVKVSLENAGVTTDLSKLTEEETQALLSAEPDKATQVQVIDSLDLPDIAKTDFIENNNDEMYQALGITSFYRYISSYAARQIVKVGTYISVFILLRLIFILIGVIITHVVEELPALSAANRLCGMIFGLVSGMILIWMFMIVASFVFGASYDGMVAQSEILTMIDQHNVVLYFLKKL